MANMAAHPFTLRQLQYALAVADALSFRKAAERCHVSQPTLSAQLAQLEQVLGVRLFERDHRRVLPTTAGRELVDLARRLVVQADDLVEAARRAGDPFAGTLRLGVIPTISPYLLPLVAPALRSSYERLSIIWVEEKTAALVRLLEAGELDAAVLALEAEIGDVERHVIARDPFVLAAPHGHALGARGAPLRPADLRGASVLLLDEGHCFREQALSFCAKARTRELEFRATSLPTLVQMVAAGAGVTLLPQLAAAAESGRTDLKLRSFAEPAPHRTIGLVWRKGSPLRGTLGQVAETIARAYPRGISARSGSAPSRRPARARGYRRWTSPA